MLYKTHLIFAFLISLIILKLFPESFNILFIPLVLLSSFLPDIDIHTSKIGQKFKVSSFIINKIFHHRGFFHSIFFPLLLYIIFNYIFELKKIALILFIGTLSHIILDLFTVEGIAFFTPFFHKRINGFIKTGGISEKIFFILILFISLFLSYKIFL